MRKIISKISYSVLLALGFLVALFFIKGLMGSQLKSKVRLLIEANRSMTHYQGMAFDLTGLGPFIVFNVESDDRFIVSYLRISVEKNVFERSFDTGVYTTFRRVGFNFKQDDFHVELSAFLTMQATILIVAYSVGVILFCNFLWLLLKFTQERHRSRELSSLAKQVAHDIRSPLQVLKALNEELVALPEDSKKRIRMSVNRIEEIAFNLLKSNTNDKSNSIRPHQLQALLDDIITDKRFEHSGLTNITIESRSSEDVYNLYASVNRNSLQSIISNIVNNSVEALSDKSGTVFVKLSSDGLCSIIEIEDNGKGISPQNLDKIFIRGFTTKEKGNGLGLSSAYKAIKAWERNKSSHIASQNNP